MELLYYLCEVLDCSADYLLHREIFKAQLTENNDEKQNKQLLYDILAEPMLLEIGTGWIEYLTQENKNQFPGIKELRKKLAVGYGVLFPVIRIRDNVDIGEYEYRITAYDRNLYSETVGKDNLSFGSICSRLETVTLENYDKILNRQMVQILVDNVAEKYPAVVKGIIPDKVPLALLKDILSALVISRKPIRNLVKIIEVLEEEFEHTDNKEELLELLIGRLYQ
jgi:flagellar biosynthesis component FlhA